jgi:hypothetical protein
MKALDAGHNPHDERIMRRCRKCNQTRSIAEYPWRKATSSYEWRCYDCKRVYEREHKRQMAAARLLKRRPWSVELIAKLNDCIARGMTPDETAAALGRTRRAIFSQRSRQSLPRFTPRQPPKRRTSWPQSRVATLKALRDGGKSFTECAAKLGTTRNAIAHAARYLKEGARP